MRKNTKIPRNRRIRRRSYDSNRTMNMTSEPNQLSRPTVFGFDNTYPSGVNWNEYPQASGAYIPQAPFTHFAPQSHDMPTTNYSFYSSFGTIPSPISFPLAQIHNEPPHSRPFHTTFRCKRKTDSPPPVNVKQHITEERMAEHLSKLHISSEHPGSSIEPETSDTREKRLYMCEEMRKLQTESIIPASLLERYQRPCTALVLWTPPQRPIPREDTPNNNNEEEVPDNNLMDLDR